MSEIMLGHYAKCETMESWYLFVSCLSLLKCWSLFIVSVVKLELQWAFNSMYSLCYCVFPFHCHLHQVHKV